MVPDRRRRLVLSRATWGPRLALAVFGAALGLVALELALRLGGLLYSYRTARAGARPPGAYRILCLGESETAFGGDWSYPRQLERILNQRVPGTRFSIVNRGVPGTNTTTILKRLDASLEADRPDMVVVMMGVNDYAWTDTDDWAALERLSRWRTSRVYKLARWLALSLDRRRSSLARRVDSHLRDNARTGSVYRKLAWENIIDGKTTRASELLFKALDASIINLEFYNAMRSYFSVAPEYFTLLEAHARRQLTVNASDPAALAALGVALSGSRREREAESALRAAAAAAPGWFYPRLLLGRLLSERGDWPGARGQLDEGVRLGPSEEELDSNQWLYWKLACEFERRGLRRRAEEILETACARRPNSPFDFAELGRRYERHGKWARARRAYEQALRLQCDDAAFVCERLAAVCARLGDGRAARALEAKATRLRAEVDSEPTKRNYRALRDAVLRRGLRLVCVQYPNTSVKPLKRMLGSDTRIVFVDNEAVFRDALRRMSTDQIFKDMFAGNFGHGTALGNRILAENIAETLIARVFRAGP